MSKELVNKFIYDKLLPDVLRGATKKSINVSRLFKDFLSDKDISGNVDEISEKYLPEIIRKIDLKSEELEKLGIPKFLDKDETRDAYYLIWRHDDFRERTGIEPLPEDFTEVLDWIESLSSKEFLIACAVTLKIMGANKIFITDSSGDEGIDCIGLVESDALKSTILYVQSKTTSNGDITRDTVLMEFGKYLSLPHTKKYQEYRSALGVDGFLDGASSIYLFISNSEFKPPAREVAKNLGILLRSKIQLALWLSQRTSRQNLDDIYEKLKLMLNADLSRDISRHICI